MAISAHIAIGMSIGRVAADSAKDRNIKPWLLAFSALAFLPDIDFLWSSHPPYGLEQYPPFSLFSNNIDMLSTWGHRGFTHSIGFAVGIGLLLIPVLKIKKRFSWKLFGLITLAVLSHPLIDMLSWIVLLTWPFEGLVELFELWPNLFHVQKNRVEFTWQLPENKSFWGQILVEWLYCSPLWMYACRPIHKSSK